MRYRRKKELLEFYDVSVIIPLLEVPHHFQQRLDQNKDIFSQNGVEIVLVLGPELSDKILMITRKYPFINFNIVELAIPSTEISAGILYKVGLQQASFQYILLLSEFVHLEQDLAYKNRYLIHYYRDIHIYSILASENNLDRSDEHRETSLFLSARLLKAIGDFNGGHSPERCLIELSLKLELKGIRRFISPETGKKDLKYDDAKRIDYSIALGKYHSGHVKGKADLMAEVNLNESSDGSSTNSIWHWSKNKDLQQLDNYLLQFEKTFKRDDHISKEFEIVALIQVRNEADHIEQLIPHLEEHCDGIIVLDDGSEDGSYEKAVHEKVILKVQKKHKGYFDDLENRNILLRLCSFIRSDWFFFIDADERFDPRFSKLRHYCSQKEIDIFWINLVDMWNKPNTYRTDIPNRPPSGIIQRSRMFRNKGNLQINTDREIHFPSVPYSQPFRLARSLLLHYGAYDTVTRQRKLDLYSKQDADGQKQGYKYDYLKDRDVTLKNLDVISIDGAS